MRASKIVLAIVAGALVGGVIALAAQARMLDDVEENDESGLPATDPDAHDSIAHRFSKKFSAELKAAEEKLKKEKAKVSGLMTLDDPGVFL